MTSFVFVLVILLYLLLIILTIGGIILTIIYLISITTDRVPFKRVRTQAMPELVNALNLKPDSHMYDLGSGDGRVLFASFNHQPQATYKGIDINILAHTFATIRHKLKGSPKNISFVKKDFFKEDISNATHVFVYLLPWVNKIILPKLEAELKPGTRVVTVDYQFVTKVPVKVIEINNHSYKRCRKIFVYEF